MPEKTVKVRALKAFHGAGMFAARGQEINLPEKWVAKYIEHGLVAKVADYAGLGQRSPLMALAMTTFLVSLGGAPPTVGLWAKFAIIEAVTVDFTVFGIVLVSFLVINSVIAFFYYLRVVKLMWFEESPEGMPRLQPSFSLSVSVTALMVATVVLGLLPGLISRYSAITSLVAAR
jgi:NADH-quinone oxidoreductase subunit N